MALLKIKNLEKSYKEAGGILKGVSLDVEKGEVVVILGPSGCGKSTLLRCINGLESIQGGEILLDGEVISNRKNDMHLIRQKVGMVFQSYDLFPNMTVLKNILLGPLKAQKRDKDEVTAQAEKLLARVGLLEKKDSYPRQLSGGQKQRVAIVRALCMNPEVLLFDEVTAALDPDMVREVLDVMILEEDDVRQGAQVAGRGSQGDGLFDITGTGLLDDFQLEVGIDIPEGGFGGLQSRDVEVGIPCVNGQSIVTFGEGNTAGQSQERNAQRENQCEGEFLFHILTSKKISR